MFISDHPEARAQAAFTPTTLNPTTVEARNGGCLLTGGTRGAGTRTNRKPQLLEILVIAHDQGRISHLGLRYWPKARIGENGQVQLYTVPGPVSLTWARLGELLVEEIWAYRALADGYDPDLDRDERELARFRETEAGVREQRAMMWRAMGGPTGDAALGDTDGWLRVDAQYWRDRADELAAELGHDFVEGTCDRAARLRDWVRNFKEQGRLPADFSLAKLR